MKIGLTTSLPLALPLSVSLWASALLFILPNIALSLPSPSPAVGPFGAKSQLLSPKPPAATVPARTMSGSGATSGAISGLVAGFGCGDLRRIALRLSTHASNLANRNTTRTPAGGPYKQLEVVCKAAGGAFCNIEANGRTRTVQQPGHPDADQYGNVQYPDINVGSESAGLNMAAAELKMLAKEGVCGTAVIEQEALMIVKYNPDFDVRMDTISFTSDGRMARWSRTTREGRTQNLSFADDGTPVGL